MLNKMQSPQSLYNLISQNRAFIMFVAIIMIVLFHQEYIDDYLCFHWFGFWGVDLFLVVSGFGVSYSLEHNSLDVFYKNRIKRLMPSCIIIGVLTLLISHIIGYNIENNILRIFSIDSWYVYAIIIYYAASSLFKKLITKYGFYVILIFAIVGVIVNLLPIENCHYLISKLRWISSRTPSFLFGMYIYTNKNLFSSNKCYILSAICCLVNLILRYFQMMYFEHCWASFVLIFSTTPFMIYIISALSKYISNKVVQFVSVITLEIYLWHTYMFAFSPFENNYMNFALIMLAVLCLSFLSNKIGKVIYDFIFSK